MLTQSPHPSGITMLSIYAFCISDTVLNEERQRQRAANYMVRRHRLNCKSLRITIRPSTLQHRSVRIQKYCTLPPPPPLPNPTFLRPRLTSLTTCMTLCLSRLNPGQKGDDARARPVMVLMDCDIVMSAGGAGFDTGNPGKLKRATVQVCNKMLGSLCG